MVFYIYIGGYSPVALLEPASASLGAGEVEVR
jgi:hypothetical protein